LGIRIKLALMVAAAVVLLGFSFWLMVGLRVWGSVALLLQGCAVALVIWAFFARDEKHVGLLEFVVKGFAVSFVLTFFVWFVNLWGAVSWVLTSSVLLWVFDLSFWIIVLGSSLVPLAIVITAYGVSRERLPTWVILLSSWCVCISGVFAVVDVWRLVFIYPYITGTPYVGGAGPIAADMLLVSLAFFIAGVFTAIYAVLKKPRLDLPL
jgi:hypothetical protein